MSSPPDNQPANQSANQPRVIVTDEGERITKAEYIENRDLPGRYNNLSSAELLDHLEQIIPESFHPDMPYFERFREQHLAQGTISNDQDEILKSVRKKIVATGKTALVVQFALEAWPEDEPTGQIQVQLITTLHDEVKYRAIFFIEQYDILLGHIDWLEHFAEFDAQNIEAMIQDAEEFPEPLWQVPEQSEQAAPSEQPEQGEQTE
ncbi:hypothetical protein EV127DRAFT_487152 [Xylaria flabelliformis]|nr:hypothetical protein EV127DRAFT_487152 [Xylaria flabelliformis]KAI0861720.1 hypothetical protein F4860DRAFT_513514 [Xylaria cubensis]